MDQARVLQSRLFGRMVGFDLVTTEPVPLEKGGQRQLDNLFHLTVRSRQTGIFDKPDQRENGPPEKGQSVGGKRPQEADPVRAEANFFP